MSLSKNTLSVPTSSIETHDIVPTTHPLSSYITKSDLDNTLNYIHTDIKASFKATNNNIVAINDNIAAMIVKTIQTNYKQKH